MDNSAKKFLAAISGNPEIRECLETYQAAEGMEKEDYLIAAAGKFGYSFTKEELTEALRCRQEELKASAAGAEDAVREISPEELDSVAGGDVGWANGTIKGKKKDHDECSATFKDKENCWINDACDMILLDYYDYICKTADVHDWDGKG